MRRRARERCLAPSPDRSHRRRRLLRQGWRPVEVDVRRAEAALHEGRECLLKTAARRQRVASPLGVDRLLEGSVAGEDEHAVEDSGVVHAAGALVVGDAVVFLLLRSTARRDFRQRRPGSVIVGGLHREDVRRRCRAGRSTHRRLRNTGYRQACLRSQPRLDVTDVIDVGAHHGVELLDRFGGQGLRGDLRAQQRQVAELGEQGLGVHLLITLGPYRRFEIDRRIGRGECRWTAGSARARPPAATRRQGEDARAQQRGG